MYLGGGNVFFLSASEFNSLAFKQAPSFSIRDSCVFPSRDSNVAKRIGAQCAIDIAIVSMRIQCLAQSHADIGDSSIGDSSIGDSSIPVCDRLVEAAATGAT